MITLSSSAKGYERIARGSNAFVRLGIVPPRIQRRVGEGSKTKSLIDGLLVDELGASRVDQERVRFQEAEHSWADHRPGVVVEGDGENDEVQFA